MVFGEVKEPELENAGWDSASEKLQLTFDKPVNEQVSLVKVDGLSLDLDEDKDYKTLTPLGDANKNTLAGNYTYTVDVTEDEAKTVGKEGNHEVTLFDVAETSTTNPATASVLNADYSVSDETVAPEVVGIKALNANKFFIETNKHVNLDSDASLEVRKGNHLFTTKGELEEGSVSDDSSVYYEKAEAGDPNGPGYYVVVSDKNTAEDSEDKNPLYNKNQSKADLDVSVKGYKDDDKLVGQAYTGSLTLEKSADKPKIDDSSLNVDDNKVNVDFEGTLEQKGSINSDNVVVRDKDGVIVPTEKYSLKVTNTKADNADNKRIEVTFKETDFAKNNEPLTIEVKAGTVNYKEHKTSVKGYQLAGQKNDKLTTTVKSEEQDNFKFVTPEDVVTSTEDKTNVITVKYGEKMTDSALNLENYKWDGKALPEDTKVDFYENKETVKITMPKETVKKDGTNYKFEISTDVKTADGRTVVNNTVDQKAYSKTIALKDNVSPEIQSGATYLLDSNEDKDSDRIKISFSEAVELNEGALDNFKLEVDGTEQSVTSVDAGSEANELILTLTDSVNVSQSATITVVEDGEGNINVTDTSDLKNKLVKNGVAKLAAGKTEVVPVTNGDDDGNGEDDEGASE